jgi:hypothetical protein
MSMNPHLRIGLSVLGWLAIGSCSSSSDATGPGNSTLTVTLTASQTRLTAPGDIILSASAADVNGAGVQKVEFYEQLVGVDANPRKIGEDLETPYEMTRSILSAAENGDRAFSAKGYDVAGHVGVSNSAMVTVAVPTDPTPFQATVAASHTRITTPGHINFIISANKAVAKAEIYVGTTKIADVIAPTAANPASVSVTRADNGTHTYVVKVYDSEGSVIESAPMTVEVDIRWDFVLPIEGIRSHDPPLIATDATGAVYFAGGTETWGVFLVKHDANGNRLWIRNFGGGGVDHPEHPKSVGVDASGRVFLVGTAGNGTRSYDCFLALYDASGSLLRAQVVDLPGIGLCVAASDGSGSIYIFGSASDSGQGTLFLIKYDGSGSVLWTQRFGGTPTPRVGDLPNDDVLTSIAIDPLGGVYVGGYTNQSFDGAPNRGPRDLFLVKFDADGNRLWSRQWGKAGLFTFGDYLAADPDGGVYFAGQVDPRITYNTGSALLVRYGSDGTLRWTRTLDAGGNLGAQGVAADQRGVYLVGFTNRGGPDQLIESVQGGYDAFLAQVTRDGDLLAVRLLGTPASEFGDAVAIGVNGDMYMAGWTVYDQPAAIFTPFLARHRDP